MTLRKTTFSDEIIKNLFLGSQDAFNEELALLVSQFNLRGVVRAIRHVPGDFQQGKIRAENDRTIREAFAKAKLFEFEKEGKQSSMLHVVEIDDIDTEDMFPHFISAIEFIESHLSANNSVLVHCAAGISRSATIVCAYIMKKMKLSAEEALDLMKASRCRICPNEAFLENLLEFEKVVLPRKENPNDNDNNKLQVKLVNKWCYRFPTLFFSDLRKCWQEALQLYKEQEEEEEHKKEEEEEDPFLSRSACYQKMKQETIFEKVCTDLCMKRKALKEQEQQLDELI